MRRVERVGCVTPLHRWINPGAVLIAISDIALRVSSGLVRAIARDIIGHIITTFHVRGRMITAAQALP